MTDCIRCVRCKTWYPDIKTELQDCPNCKDGGTLINFRREKHPQGITTTTELKWKCNNCNHTNNMFTTHCTNCTSKGDLLDRIIIQTKV